MKGNPTNDREPFGGWQYRVTWRREGQAGKRRQQFETRAAAERCRERQETALAEMDWVTPRVAPLAEQPTVERRRVGGWEPVE